MDMSCFNHVPGGEIRHDRWADCTLAMIGLVQTNFANNDTGIDRMAVVTHINIIIMTSNDTHINESTAMTNNQK